MRKVAVVAKTVELAIADALSQLQVGRDRIEVTVKSAPTRGFLGFGAKDAEVEVRVIEDPVADAERFLREMFVTMRLAIKVTTEVRGDEVIFHFTGDKVAILIGKHGQTLDAIQTLVQAVGNKYADQHLQFTVDAEGYRERRRQQLIYAANKAAQRALTLGKEVPLEPMNAQERKVIHIALQNRQDVRTESRGQDPGRAIVVIPAAAKRSVGVGTPRKMSVQ
ncbi:MAG: protein jag [Firmicutes bacterium]|nr:protein jag [Bacillota bacterium]